MSKELFQMNARENFAASVEFLQKKIKSKPEVVITLGSGLSNFVNQVKVEERISYSQIPGFVRPTVEGHPGELVLGRIGEKTVLVLRGRFHFYEGYTMHEVVHPTRVAKQLGASILVLTNAAGGFGEGMRPGHFMVIRDHINLTGQNPLIGANWSDFGPRFPDMTEAYDGALRTQLKTILTKLKVPHSEGVYCGVSGPNYETPAEIEFFKRMGAQAVGMSTVPEAIVARHCGFRLAGLSCITNLAAGLGGKTLAHEEVTEVARGIETAFAAVLVEFVSTLK
jgi:purine-nucleoside phosphorylase